MSKFVEAGSLTAVEAANFRRAGGRSARPGAAHMQLLLLPASQVCGICADVSRTIRPSSRAVVQHKPRSRTADHIALLAEEARSHRSAMVVRSFAPARAAARQRPLLPAAGHMRLAAEGPVRCTRVEVRRRHRAGVHIPRAGNNNIRRA